MYSTLQYMNQGYLSIFELSSTVHTSGPAVDQPRGECERRGQGDGDPPAPGSQVSEDQQKLLLCQLLSNPLV